MTGKRWRRRAAWLAAAVVTGALASGCARETASVDAVIADAEIREAENGTGLSVSEKDMAMAMAAAPAFTDVSDTVYIVGNQVRLRTSPTTSDASNIYTTLNNGTSLSRTGDSDDWCRVSYQGQTLYVAKAYVSDEAPATAQTAASSTAGTGTSGTELTDGSQITLDDSWLYADYSAIKTGAAVLYRSSAATRKEITVCVNAGHGTSGGEQVKTLCHPDGSAKVTSGSTASGATEASAVSSGMTFSDGTAERDVTLALAKILKSKLLADGYDVVMIRESDDVQLDNIARTVLANNTSDCHISLHWDSTTSDKGAFYMSVPDVDSYRSMEPVASNWQKHHALGESLIFGLRSAGVKIYSGGSMAMDLTQTSYSTIPSVDIELGDKASDHSDATLEVLAEGLLAGINSYFGK